MAAPASARRGFPVRTNYRGKPVGVWLGIAYFAVLAGWIAISTTVSVLTSDRGLTPVRSRLLWMAAGCALTFLAGLYDDYQATRTRGLVSQLRALLHGGFTSGLVKMIVITAASGLVVWKLGGRGWRLAIGIPVVAGAANVWNLLDVAPGRALKYFLPAVAALGIVAAEGGSYPPLAASALGAGLGAILYDLRERAMLGDAGANLLGFIVGVGLFEILNLVGLIVALSLIVVVHVLSETVTLSRMIETTPPLRWFDRLGRLRLDQAKPETGPNRRDPAAN